jgi:hypothetical protein
VLDQERGQRLLRQARRAREVRGRAEQLAATHEQHADRVVARLPCQRKCIEVAPPVAAGELRRLDLAQARELVADQRRPLEVQLLGGLLHALLELLVDLGVAPFEHQHRRVDVARIVVAADQADTGRRAAADLVLQAGA